MDNKNLISIIIPVYNRPKLVAECLDSVLAQTNPNWECIVVDDGSTDNTWEVLESYSEKDERIRIFKRNREPKGASTCRNIGADKSAGDYIIFFDSDDLFFPWAFDELISNMSENKEVDCGISQQVGVNKENTSVKWYRSIKDTPKNYIYRLMSFQRAFSTPSVIWRKSAVNQSNKWIEGLKCFQDPPMHLSAILNGINFKWITDMPTALIRGNNQANQITKSSKIINFIHVISDLYYQIDDSDLQRRIKKAVKAKIYSSSYFLINYATLKEETKTIFKTKLFSKKESFVYLTYFYVYFKVKNISILQKAIYHLGYLFYKKHVWFEKSYLKNKDELNINKKLIELTPNCNIAKKYFTNKN